MIKKIIYLTCTRPDYSLNSVLIKGLRENGVEVVEFHIKDRGMSGFVKALSFYRDNFKNADAIIVGYNSQILIPLLRLFCRKKIIYNAILSEYERMIISRELTPRFSIKAFYYWLIDFIAVHLADLTTIESNHQLNFFNRIFKVSKKKLYRRFIGVDEDKFFYDPAVSKYDTFTVVFRGALQPEAGAEYVVQAAKILERENIKFIMLSGGLLLDKINKLVEELKPVNLEFRSDLLPIEELRTVMQKCHLSLGQLSNHPRLERTIPHKIYESLTMRLPYLTASNAGILELLTAGETCITCGSADAQSVAEKILWAKNNPQELERIARNGYQLYQDKLKSHILAKNLLEVVI
ncbi:MAG: glycosyltransferase [bacterium]|nr:glycosyltransferase [bacterium]